MKLEVEDLLVRGMEASFGSDSEASRARQVVGLFVLASSASLFI